MTAIRLLLCAALAPALALAAAGHTAFSSYIGQVPPLPRDAKQAYGAMTLNPPGSSSLFSQPAAYTSLQAKLDAEARLAASSSGPGAAMGITDEASARALQQQMAGMSQAQQMALAQQMAAQVNASMQPGPLGPDDRKVVELLDQRQNSSMSRIEATQRLQQELAAAMQRWQAAHALLAGEEAAKLERTPPVCSKGTDMDSAALAVHEEYAQKHLERVRDELKEGVGLFERQRVIALDDAAFADRLAPLMKKAKGPLAGQGYTAARQDAVRQISGLSGLSWTFNEHAATWWHNKLDTSSARRCMGSG